MQNKTLKHNKLPTNEYCLLIISVHGQDLDRIITKIFKASAFKILPSRAISVNSTKGMM